jgi:TPR repeat protein
MFRRFASFVIGGLALSVATAAALDGVQSPGTAPAPTPLEAFRSGAKALKAGETQKAVTALEYAAQQGHTASQWKLGRMYADGDQVPKNDLRAFQYFSRIANGHAEDNPETPQSRFVANAFVALGQYYLDGIPNSVKADTGRAREMFAYAASYFGDADAQYHLARMYLDGTGAPRDPRRAAQWLALSANKGQVQAQAQLGHMLFKGDHVPRQAARGLMWLMLARDGAGGEKWIAELYDAAVRQATADEQSLALHYLERWMRGRRD